jgi:hypothetical protein
VKGEKSFQKIGKALNFIEIFRREVESLLKTIPLFCFSFMTILERNPLLLASILPNFHLLLQGWGLTKKKTKEWAKSET